MSALPLPARGGRGTLPREARDTLFLLAISLAALLPHAGHLPWWCSVLTAGMLGWRARLAWRSEPCPAAGACWRCWPWSSG